MLLPLPTAQAQVTATASTVADATIMDDLPDANFGENHTFELVHGDTTNVHHDGILRWDLSAIPPGSTIVDAQANIFLTEITNDPGEDESTFLLFILVDGWGERTVSWNHHPATPPAAGNTSTVTANEADERTFVRWNVTTFVDRWVNDAEAWPNHGVILSPGVPPFDNTTWELATREHSTIPWRPFLRVTYVAGTDFGASTHPLAVHISNLGIPVTTTLFAIGLLIFLLPVGIISLLASGSSQDYLTVMLFATSGNIAVRFWPPIMFVFLALLVGWMIADILTGGRET